jgi:TetR/AcrR family transcriptional regulator
VTESETTEKRIIAGARMEFIENGFRGARMQAIADRCGVNKALLHYYYRTKERLYEAVFHDIAQTMRCALEETLVMLDTNNDLRSFLRSIITAYIQTLRKNSDFPRFFLREMADGGKMFPAFIQSVAPSFSNVPIRIHAFLKKEKLAGRIRNIPPLHVLLNVLGMCIFTFIAQPVVVEINRQFNIGLAYDNDFFETRIEAILEMTMHGIAVSSQ